MANITRVTRMKWVNCYLVDEDDGLTLVDTMIPGSSKQILDAADSLGKPIVRIALTHAHMDHIGSLDDLAEALPEAEVTIGTRESRLLAKDLTVDPGEGPEKLRGGYPGAKTKPGRLLEPGDRVGSLEVVASPGHTPGHVAFLDTRDRTLICGDVFTTIGHVETSGRFSLPFPAAYMGTWNRPLVVETARKLRELDPAALAPGHGKIVESPAPAMEQAIAKAS